MIATGLGLIFLTILINMVREPLHEPSNFQVAIFFTGAMLTAAGVLAFCWRVLP